MKWQRRIFIAWALAGFGYSQPASRFDVISIKPAPVLDVLEADIFAFTRDPGLFRCRNCQISEIIVRAFELKPHQFSEPDWMASARFDISATSPENTNDEQFRSMLQNLLADRFKMVSHFEKKEAAGYDLLVAKNGPKLQKSPGSPGEVKDTPPAEDFKTDSSGFPVLPPGREVAGAGIGLYMTNRFADESMDKLAKLLTYRLKAPVTDATGLTGRYDFTLRWMRTGLVESAESGFGQAVEKQLGLRLQKTRKSIDFLVIDHLEKEPTDN